MSKQKYEEVIVRRAHDVWKVMHAEAKKRGMALAREKELGDGRVIVATIAAFIKGLNKERDWGLDDPQVDLVRRYLKASGNVVTLNKMEDYRFRIFVRETWSNQALLTTPVEKSGKDTKGEKLSPAEAGENREPAPVTYKCSYCSGEFASSQSLAGHIGNNHRQDKQKTQLPVKDDEDDFYVIGEVQASALRVLSNNGGTVERDDGRISTYFREQDSTLETMSLASAMKALDDRGWVTRDINGKRTYKVSLTPDGVRAVKDLDYYRHARYPISEYLAEVGMVKSRDVAALLSDHFGFPTYRVYGALRTLQDEGLVECDPSAGEHRRIRKVTWQGERTEPVKPEPVAEPVAETKEEPVKVDARRLDLVPDETLIEELKTRLSENESSVSEVADLRDRVALVASLVDESINGQLSPLKALAEIQEAVNI